MSLQNDHTDHSLYVENKGAFYIQPPIPNPPKEGLSVSLNTYDDVEEPRFDPKIHLNLDTPHYVRLLPDFQKSFEMPKAQNGSGSSFAYSSPFQVLSDEGVRVIKEIVYRNAKSVVPAKHARGNKKILRGLYYLSPFLRDLQNDLSLREHFEKIAGEPLIPHGNLSSSPQINLSDPDLAGPVDIWHWDSVAYTGVLLLNPFEDFVGGELELMKVNKREGLRLLETGEYEANVHSEIVSYERPGKMILAQGSEVLHHVRPVLSDTTRISMIFGYAPANCFQPPKTVLNTFLAVDVVHELGQFEFFREKAWQAAHCLKYYVENVKYSKDGDVLGKKLRVVAEELIRSADLLDGRKKDKISFYDDHNKMITQEFGASVVRKI